MADWKDIATDGQAVPTRASGAARVVQMPFAAKVAETTAPRVFWGSANPNGTQNGRPSDYYLQDTGQSGRAWVKRSGVNTVTGWEKILFDNELNVQRTIVDGWYGTPGSGQTNFALSRNAEGSRAAQWVALRPGEVRRIAIKVTPGASTLHEERFDQANGSSLRTMTPSGSPAFASPFNNGEGSGELPSTLNGSGNWAKIANPGQFAHDAQNTATSGLASGLCIGPVTSTFDNFTVTIHGSTPQTAFGVGGGFGLCFRFDDHRASPEDNSEGAEQGQGYVVKMTWPSGLNCKVECWRYKGGGSPNVGVVTTAVLETTFSVGLNEKYLLQATVNGDLMTVVRSTVPGDFVTNLKTVVSNFNLLTGFGGSEASLNSAAFGAFGVDLPAKSITDHIDFIRVTREVGLGVVTAKVFKNGSFVSGGTVSLDTASQLFTADFPAGAVEYDAGDLLDVRVDTDGAYNAAPLKVSLEIENRKI